MDIQPFKLVVSLDRVAIGSREHLIPILCSIVFAIIFIFTSKRHLSQSQQKRALHLFAIIVSLTVLSFHMHLISLGNYNVATDLPLYLCSLLALLIPVFTYYQRFWMYEILLFWVIAGTLQGVITPDIAQGFPAFDYFRYWMVHLGLLIIMSYATIIFGFRPKLKSVFKSFLALQLYILLMMAINYILNANYFYLNEKPKSASLLDFFGEWPYYIIVGQLILIPYFLIIYLPFYLVEKKK